MALHPLGFVKAVIAEFAEDEVTTRAAALAYYSALAFAPLLILLLWFAGLFGAAGSDGLRRQVEQVIGPQAAQAVQVVLENARSNPSLGNLAGIIALVTLLFSATGVLAQLQTSLNRVWDVRAAPGRGLKNWFRKRLLSIAMVFAVGFLLLVSMVVSGILSYLSQSTADLPGGTQLWQVVTFVVSLGIFTLLFAGIYKYLPDVRIAWRDVWLGAAVTSILFALGKWLVGLYLGRGSVGSAYGAAGSIVVLLVWVFYASLILFIGAEVTQVAARRLGRSIEPDRRFAVPLHHPEAGTGTRTG